MLNEGYRWGGYYAAWHFWLGTDGGPAQWGANAARAVFVREWDWTFGAGQTVTRTFLVACTACAVVIIAEEIPAKNRGWGIGILGALGSLGFGLGALLYARLDLLPFGWRTMYLVGGVPLLLLWLRSKLKVW